MNNTEKKYMVYIMDKVTHEKQPYTDDLILYTEDEAFDICDSWGWFYSDENGKSYYMCYDVFGKEELANDILEIMMWTRHEDVVDNSEDMDDARNKILHELENDPISIIKTLTEIIYDWRD